jgi:type II secretory pathway component PulC
MKKERLDEHDITKNMIDILRGGFKKLITENDDQQDSLSPKPGDAVFNDELKKLQDTVDPRVKITNFKIYPVDQNVIIEGTFLQREDANSGIKFKMSLAAGDIETSMNNIDLSDKVSLLLQKLKGYYDNWVDEWALKLANEYRPKQN